MSYDNFNNLYKDIKELNDQLSIELHNVRLKYKDSFEFNYIQIEELLNTLVTNILSHLTDEDKKDKCITITTDLDLAYDEICFYFNDKNELTETTWIDEYGDFYRILSYYCLTYDFMNALKALFNQEIIDIYISSTNKILKYNMKMNSVVR